MTRKVVFLQALSISDSPSTLNVQHRWTVHQTSPSPSPSSPLAAEETLHEDTPDFYQNTIFRDGHSSEDFDSPEADDTEDHTQGQTGWGGALFTQLY